MSSLYSNEFSYLIGVIYALWLIEGKVATSYLIESGKYLYNQNVIGDGCTFIFHPYSETSHVYQQYIDAASRPAHKAECWLVTASEERSAWTQPKRPFSWWQLSRRCFGSEVFATCDKSDIIFLNRSGREPGGRNSFQIFAHSKKGVAVKTNRKYHERNPLTSEPPGEASNPTLLSAVNRMFITDETWLVYLIHFRRTATHFHRGAMCFFIRALGFT